MYIARAWVLDLFRYLLEVVVEGKDDSNFVQATGIGILLDRVDRDGIPNSLDQSRVVRGHQNPHTISNERERDRKR